MDNWIPHELTELYTQQQVYICNNLLLSHYNEACLKETAIKRLIVKLCTTIACKMYFYNVLYKNTFWK